MVLLRWYKSFNISYRSEAVPRIASQSRPWNAIDVGNELADDYPFIEIPLEQDITTIVGGNESGKSHLISAISKVLIGVGVKRDRFSQTDFCRYATVPNQDATRWPNIGVHFKLDTDEGIDEAKRIKDAVPSIQFAPEHISEFTLILGTSREGIVGHLFVNRAGPGIALTSDDLKKLRGHLPRVQFIDAEAALPDNMTLLELLAACDPDKEIRTSRFGSAVAQKAAELLVDFKVEPNGTLSAEQRTKIENVRSTLVVNRVDLSADARLAATLFTDILDITSTELKQVLDQPVAERGYSEYFLRQWNDKIFERLDLAHFWQQDDQASIELIYKDQTLYFDITDKTGATYTFKERSSGLRYFLSYYIQAKALERKGRDRHAMILMDEPDSFLSIIAQHNLLAVFESIVGRERAAGRAQLVYTTHSPFLINRNFPRRIRVVVKEEAEEGTQYYGKGSARRFEPVRSALGIDSAQTLFMGATNLVLEGLTDQYLINEVVRALATPENAQDYLDLNAVVVVSADGVFNIEKVLAASQWGEEPVPATVVLVDGDAAGKQAIADISGQTEGKRKLIDADFCIPVDTSIHESLKGRVVETIEDLIPRAVYVKAFHEYVKKWHVDVIKRSGSKLETLLTAATRDSTIANVACVRKVTASVDGLVEDYDKLGVLEEVICLVRASAAAENKDVQAFIDTMKVLYRRLNDTVNRSRQQAARSSMSTNVKRLIREFVRVRETGCAVIELQRHLQRLAREGRAIHGIGERLAVAVEFLERQIQQVEQTGQAFLTGDVWTRWRGALERIRREPLDPQSVEAELTVKS